MRSSAKEGPLQQPNEMWLLEFEMDVRGIRYCM